MLTTKLKPLVLGMTLAALPASASVIISEYVEGSSNNKAIELYNAGTEAVDLSAYALQTYFNGKTDAPLTIALAGTLAAKQTYVVAHASSAQAVLDKAQQTTAASWFNGDDAIVLVQGDTIIDSFGKRGEDPGSYWSGNGVQTMDRTLRRISSINAGRTEADGFFDPSAQWLSFDKDDFSDLGQHAGSTTDPTDPTDPTEPPVEPLVCGDTATAIHTIQGAGATSPLVDQIVTVEAVVTADLQADNELKGFFIQHPAAEQDNDTLTSEGIFVYYTGTDVKVGDRVRLRAKVQEYFNATQLGFVDALEVCGQGSVAATTLTLPNDNLEAVEGMLVNINQSLKVVDSYGLARYGEVLLATERLYQSTQVALPGADANAVEAANLSKQILLDDGSTKQNLEPIRYPAPGLDAYNTLRLGDTADNLQGVITYSFDKYRLHPTVEPIFSATNPRTDAPALDATGDLRIASFNVLNYFNGDGQGGGFPTSRGASSAIEFQRQKAKIVSAILALDADVIGLLEIENDGFGEFSAIADLVAALNAQSAETYQYVNFNAEKIGGDAITSALIYRSSKVTEVGTAAFTEMVPFDYGNRPPIAQSFKVNATEEVFTMGVAHLRSKGSCSKAEGADQDQGDGQGCWNVVRTTAANTYADWLATHPTGVADDDIIVVGDLNSYAMEDPLRAFAAKGLASVIATQDGHTQGYSYNYAGRIGSLDHALASTSMMEKVVAATDWHINADEPVALDYNVEYKSDALQASLYAEHAYRASDHDPVIVALNTQPPVVEPEVWQGEFTNVGGWFWPKNFKIELPEGFQNLKIEVTGGWGDANLMVKQGSAPSLFRYDCLSAKFGNQDVCEFATPKAGKWFIQVSGYLPFGNVTVKYSAIKP
ncbi:ExeM/NucH family extracellular endonuclease [Pseudoalteromonas fenneropenaei]|uniref:ExeM/NucH family extracellular endonuclease n=1 Tax=Pseudoalteromonas fenneropenaei TaxID=1737459 RepID=A0ABV7CPD7_9GAMM